MPCSHCRCLPGFTRPLRPAPGSPMGPEVGGSNPPSLSTEMHRHAHPWVLLLHAPCARAHRSVTHRSYRNLHVPSRPVPSRPEKGGRGEGGGRGDLGPSVHCHTSATTPLPQRGPSAASAPHPLIAVYPSAAIPTLACRKVQIQSDAQAPVTSLANPVFHKTGW